MYHGLCFSLLLIICPSTGLAGERADRGSPATEHIDTVNYVLGTQTFGVKYKFSEETNLVETAARIHKMGSSMLKFSMSKRSLGGQYDLPKGADIDSLVELAKEEPSVRRVLEMPFAYYHIWAYPFAHGAAAWRDGLSETEREETYEEVHALASYLLDAYGGTGKTFFLGHWEGDWYLHPGYDRAHEPSPTAIRGMIDWLNVRQKAVDDLKGLTVLNGMARSRGESVSMTAIPYYAWANRDKGAMTVWIDEDTSTAKTAAKQITGNAPIKVFILAGQSNMEGQGVVEMDHPQYYNGGKGNLVWSMKHSASADKMTHLKDDNGNWVVRDDVEISFKGRGGTRTGGLTIGYTGYGGSSHIGPELQFGHVIGDHYDEPVLLIKTAWGGKSLYTDFRPPSSGGRVGPYYTKMIEEIYAALGALNYDNFDLAGFVWMQGWNDMCTKPAIPEYADNLVNLAKDVREEFNVPDLPFIVGELGNGGPTQRPGPMAEFRKAQREGTARIENAVFVETTAFARPKELSPNTGHGHHWFGNAESYFLVGDALARAAIEIIER